MDNGNFILMVFLSIICGVGLVGAMNMLETENNTVVYKQQKQKFTEKQISNLTHKCYLKNAHNIEILQEYCKPDRDYVWVFRCLRDKK